MGSTLQGGGDDPASGILRACSRAVALLCQVALALSALMLVVDTALIGAAVVLRYVFSMSLSGSNEIVAGTLTAMVLLGAPEVLRRNEHIGVDVLTNALPAGWSRWIQMWASLSVLLVAAVLVINGWQEMMLSRTIGALTQGNLELPVWMLQAALPVGGTLLALVALESIWRSIARTPRPIVAKGAPEL